MSDEPSVKDVIAAINRCRICLEHGQGRYLTCGRHTEALEHAHDREDAAKRGHKINTNDQATRIQN